MVVIEAPFVEELSVMAIVKVLDMNEHVTSMIKLKLIRNRAALKITNNTDETMNFDRSKMIGILDLRSLGYYKIKQDGLQQNLSKQYHFELAEDICTQFNRFVNLLKIEEENPKEKYLWLDDKDKKKYMTDREILDKYVNLDNSCLTKAEKKEVRGLIYKYKHVFSLRDKISTCPNIKVEIYVTDKTSFFIRPFHVKEEDQTILDEEMKRLCYLGLEGRLFCLFKPSHAHQ